MKRKIALFFIIALVVGGMVGFANDGNDDKRHRNNRCNPAGTWYAELPSPPYMATITPIQGHSRYSAVYQGLYHASFFGFEIMTDWSGELVKSGDGYDVAIIGLFGGGEDFPHWNPLQTWGVKGHMEFSDDCNTMFATWPGGIYVWTWNTVPIDPGVPPDIPPTWDTPPTPWVDDPVFPYGTDTIYETYHRMPMPTD